MNKKITALIISTVILSGCSNSSLLSSIPDNRPDYRQSRVGNPLEVPPDLTSSSIDDVMLIPELSGTDNAKLSTYQKERIGHSKTGNRLQESLKNIHHSGDKSWIEIADTPDNVFKNAKNFWLKNGLPLARVDANIGIMETDWLETNPKLPQSGIGRLISGFLSTLHDNGIRDKFRTRIDYDGKKTFVYVTHYSATEEEVNVTGDVVSGSRKGSDENTFAWIESKRNPELEVEMLRRLNLYLNRRGQQNATASKMNKDAIDFAKLQDGTPVLVIKSNFSKAWSVLGIAIDRAGFDVGTQNRKEGIYSFAKIVDKKVGFIVKKVERTVDSYTIGLAEQGGQQLAVVRTHNKKKPSPEVAAAILQKISQEIRF